MSEPADKVIKSNGKKEKEEEIAQEQVEQVVTPYTVEAGEAGVDYDFLVRERSWSGRAGGRAVFFHVRKTF